MLLRTKLLIQTILLVATLSLAGGGIGLHYTHTVADISLDLVEQEAVPILKIKTLEKLALEIWLRLLLHSSVTDMDTMERLEQELPQWHERMAARIAEAAGFYQGTQDGHSHNHQLETAVKAKWQEFQDAWQNFHASTQKVLQLSQDYEKKAAMHMLLEGEAWNAYQVLTVPLETLVEGHQQHMNSLRNQALTARQQATWAILALSAGVGLLALLVVLRFSRLLLVKPLQRFQTGLLGFFAYLNRESDSVARIEIHSNDELGVMSRLINDNVERIEQDMVKDNLFIKDVALIVNKIKAGDLRDTVTATAGNPALNELKSLLNEVLAIMTEVLGTVGANLDKLAQGELSARVSGEYQGAYARLQQSCNGIAGQIEQVFSESDTVLKRMAGGDMNVRISGNFAGDFAGIKTATNVMADKLQALIQEVGAALGQLAAGDMAARISSDFPGDFAEIKRAANAMANDLQTVIRNTSTALGQLAEGKRDVHLDSDFPGDFNQIRIALESTTATLAEATDQNTLQSWLKSGQSQLGDQTRGDKDIIRLAEDIINFLTPYLEAQVGAFYVVQGEGENVCLKMIASHAYVWRKSARHEFKIGESLVGQAALEHKLFVIAEAPEDYVHVQSGLGEAAPRAILVAPFLYDNELKGVIELAAIKPFSDVQLEFLRQALPSIAIAVNTADARTRMKELLEQSEAQTEELYAQQAEMEQQQTELKASNEKLQAQTEELQAQAEEMQSQSEELQVQQEELRQTNDMLEQRTKDLERQQAAVQEKNTELEKSRVEIQTKADELELASKYKSEFLANMSHELRTPLNSLLILAQMLADNKAGNLTDKQVEQVRTIHSAGNDLLSLINEILDLAKVEAGRVEIHPEYLDLQTLLDNTERKFRHVAEEKRVTFTLKKAGDTPETMYTDVHRLQQVINNLLSNAFKFTEQGEVSLVVYRPDHQENVPPALAKDRMLAISVTDSGIGIAEDKQQVVFEAFQQADGTTSRRYGGTGLGLSISRQLARLLGGDITLRSTPGQGSTFTLFLAEKVPVSPSPPLEKGGQGGFSKVPVSPLSTASNLREVEQQEETTAPPPSGHKSLVDDRDHMVSGHKTLLIIEDDTHFSEILMGLVHDKGYQCLFADNGHDGLHMAEQYKPDAIILDVGLPQVDGLTVMERLKENLETRHIPVHFISGSEHSDEAKKMGALGYLLKPVNMTELTDAFRKIQHFVDNEVRNLLVMMHHPQHRDEILALVGGEDIHAVSTSNADEAWQQLQQGDFDCIVLDVETGENDAVSLLDKLAENEKLRQVPVILYAERELTEAEEKRLQEREGELVIKAVYSRERLLDEATLFLHSVEKNLPEEKRSMLHKVHDRDAIFKDRKILVVDDDVRNVYALSIMLQQKDMEAFTAVNGKKALDTLNEHPEIDLALVDIMMPEMDGYETMRAIRGQSRFRKLPLIALTAKAMKGDRAKCIDAGANDYMAKPVDNDKLLSLLRVWLYR